MKEYNDLLIQNKPNILIVDDMPDNLKVLSDMLKCEGFKVRPVPSGKLALQAAEKDPPDLILLDIMMPDMDGFEVCRRFKENQHLKDIPIIFISALNETKDIVKAFTSGGVDYITKPFQIEEIKARVNLHFKIHCLQAKLKDYATKLKELNAFKDRLFSIIAHDLKNSFNIVLGSSSYLIQNWSDFQEDKKMKFIQNINITAKRTYDLLENLLLWARSQKNEIKIQPVTLDIRKIIDGNIEFLENMAKNKNIGVMNDVRQSIYAFADYDMILTVVRNLIANAIKFTYPDGKITIFCEESDDKIVISVKDSGTGMTEDDIDKLFRLDTVSKIGTSKEKGSGLGLMLCKEFVEKNSGKIWAKSELNKGSEFFVSLPKGGSLDIKTNEEETHSRAFVKE